MARTKKKYTAPPKPEEAPSISSEPLDRGERIVAPQPEQGMSDQALEDILATAQTPTESPPLNETTPQTLIPKPTSETIETPEKSIVPPPKEVTESAKEASESDGGPYEAQFQRMRDQIMTRWPTSSVAVVFGGLARQGIISSLPDWDIQNAGDLSGIILDRLKDEAYLRELWIVIVMMRNNRRGNRLGNPRVEATMVTGLAIMDYISEVCPRLTYEGVVDRAS